MATRTMGRSSLPDSILSRLMIGTGKYRSSQEMNAAFESVRSPRSSRSRFAGSTLTIQPVAPYWRTSIGRNTPSCPTQRAAKLPRRRFELRGWRERWSYPTGSSSK